MSEEKRKRQKGAPISPDELAECVRLAKSGMSISKISRLTGICHSTVGRIVHGINTPKRVSDEKIAKLIELGKNTELSGSQIGRMVGINKSYACMLLAKHGVREKQWKPPKIYAVQPMMPPEKPRRTRKRRTEYVLTIHPKGEISTEDAKKVEFDHFPKYWDMQNAFTSFGITSIDYALKDDYRKKEIQGIALDAAGKTAAWFTLTRLIDEEPDMWDLIDGADWRTTQMYGGCAYRRNGDRDK